MHMYNPQKHVETTTWRQPHGQQKSPHTLAKTHNIGNVWMLLPVLLRQNRIVDAFLQNTRGQNKKTATKLKPGTKSETPLTNLGDKKVVNQPGEKQGTPMTDLLRRQFESVEQVQTRRLRRHQEA